MFQSISMKEKIRKKAGEHHFDTCVCLQKKKK